MWGLWGSMCMLLDDTWGGVGERAPVAAVQRIAVAVEASPVTAGGTERVQAREVRADVAVAALALRRNDVRRRAPSRAAATAPIARRPHRATPSRA